MEELRRSKVLKILLAGLAGLIMAVAAIYTMNLALFRVFSLNGLLGLLIIVFLPQFWNIFEQFDISVQMMKYGMIATSWLITLIYLGMMAESVVSLSKDVSVLYTIVQYVMTVHVFTFLVTWIISRFVMKKK